MTRRSSRARKAQRFNCPHGRIKWGTRALPKVWMCQGLTPRTEPRSLPCLPAAQSRAEKGSSVPLPTPPEEQALKSFPQPCGCPARNGAGSAKALPPQHQHARCSRGQTAGKGETKALFRAADGNGEPCSGSGAPGAL